MRLQVLFICSALLCVLGTVAAWGQDPRVEPGSVAELEAEIVGEAPITVTWKIGGVPGGSGNPLLWQVPESSGFYRVEATATNVHGSDTASIFVDVEAAVRIEFEAEGCPPCVAEAGQSLYFRQGFGGEEPLIFEYDWDGDGRIDSLQFTREEYHTFDVPGVFEPFIRVHTGSGGSAEFRHTPLKILEPGTLVFSDGLEAGTSEDWQ